MHPNKLFLFARTFELEDPSWVYAQVISLVSKMSKVRGWSGPVVLPVAIKREEVTGIKARFLRSATEQVVRYDYYLVFEDPIDEKEMLFWNGLVAGMRFWNIRHWQEILD